MTLSELTELIEEMRSLPGNRIQAKNVNVRINVNNDGFRVEMSWNDPIASYVTLSREKL